MIEVLTISASRITHVTAFLDPTLFPAFALPPTLPFTESVGTLRSNDLT
jgi:hypothetical protein